LVIGRIPVRVLVLTSGLAQVRVAPTAVTTWGKVHPDGKVVNWDHGTEAVMVPLMVAQLIEPVE
jgi:hypothetical protein